MGEVKLNWARYARNTVIIEILVNAIFYANLDFIIQITPRISYFIPPITGSFIISYIFTRMSQLNKNYKFEKEKAQFTERVKTSFLSNMSHEIRTPLNTIVGAIDLSIAEEDYIKSIHYLDIAKQSGELLSAIISNILDFAKIESGEMAISNSATSLKQLMKDVYEISRILLDKNKKDICLTYSVSDDIPDPVDLDSLKLKQILLNLITNSVKFTANGLIDFSVSKSRTNTLVFTVKDTGPGIKEDELENIFIPFRQLESKDNWTFSGTGLGLPIVKNFIDKMGGEIKISSETGPDHGTVVTFSIPCLPSKNPAIAGKSCSPTNASSLKILLVEDNLLNQQIAKKLLENINAVVTTANNGEDALAEFQQNKFDLILMDIQMPVMNGIDSTKNIRQIENSQNLDKTCIIALSADATRDTMEECLTHGFNYYFTKPLDMKMINDFINSKLKCI